MSEIQSPFGVRKVRVPPPPAASSGDGPSPPPFSSDARVVGVRPPPQAPPSEVAATPNQQVNSSPFGARLVRGGSVGPSTIPASAPAAPSSSPFGPTLRSVAQPTVRGVPPPSSALGGDGAVVAGAAQATTGVGGRPPLGETAKDVVRISTGRHVPLIYLERIEGCLLQRAALKVYHRRRAISAISVIQAELRAFLQSSGATPEARAVRRRLRVQQQLELQEGAKLLALEARAEGVKLAQEEALAWSLLRRSATVLLLRSVVAVEASQRIHLEEVAQTTFVQVFLCPNPDIPAFLRPGIEKDECMMRSHIAKYERYDALKCMARAVAERAGITILDEQHGRRQLHDEEADERVHHLRKARSDYWVCCLREEEALAQRFRQVTAAQRDRFMSLMSREWAAVAALNLVEDTGPFSEVGHRHGIAEKETFYRNRLASEFVERRDFLAFAGCQKMEFSKRRGPKGIEAQERSERQVIHLAMIRGALMRLQGVAVALPLPAAGMNDGGGQAHNAFASSSGGTLCDPNTEPGDRMSIEIEEARARRVVERFLDSEAIQVFLPPMEYRQRQRIILQERRELAGIVEAVGVVPLLFCLQEEPAARKRLQAAQHKAMIECIFYWASLQLIGAELRSRAHLMQQQLVFEDRLLAMHYLARVEVTERRLLRKAIKSLHRRAQQESAQRGDDGMEWPGVTGVGTPRNHGDGMVHRGEAAPPQELPALQWGRQIPAQSPPARPLVRNNNGPDCHTAAGSPDPAGGTQRASLGGRGEARRTRAEEVEDREQLYRGTPYYQRMVVLPRSHRAAVSYSAPQHSVDALMQNHFLDKQHQQQRHITRDSPGMDQRSSIASSIQQPEQWSSPSHWAAMSDHSPGTQERIHRAVDRGITALSLSPAARRPPPQDAALDTDECLDGTTWTERIVGAASVRDDSRRYGEERKHHAEAQRADKPPPQRRGESSHVNGYLTDLLASAPSLKRYVSVGGTEMQQQEEDGTSRAGRTNSAVVSAHQRTPSRGGASSSSPAASNTRRRQHRRHPQSQHDDSDEERLFVVPAQRVA